MMAAFNCGNTSSEPGANVMLLSQFARTTGKARYTTEYDVRPALASTIDKPPLDLVLNGPLAKMARQESSIAQWELMRPLHVRVLTDSDGTIFASDDVFLNYGVGDTVAAALADYAVSLVEFYHLVSASATTNPMDKPLLDRLCAYLRES